MKKLASILFLTACVSPPVATTKNSVVQDTPIRVSQNTQNKVDILFMVDNSPSMDAMQQALRDEFYTFLGVFDDVANPTDGSKPQYADLHIGVVTSDYGAGDADGPMVAATGKPSCSASPGGDGGLLQAVGAAAPSSCKPPVAAPYIEYAFGPDHTGTCNLADGCNSAALNTQFTCMASVGSGGCGFEHQLESVYAALAKGANPGFLRDDAILAVVFVTNEDDGSAPPTTDFYNPASKSAGAYTTYRQTHFGVECGTPPALAPQGASNGPLAKCAPADMDGVEYRVSRYTDLFTTPGVLKADPLNDIILVAIDAPVTSVETILAKVGTGGGGVTDPAYVPCDAEGDSCVVALQHSCQNMKAPAFFGDPAVRIDAVVGSQHLSQTASICGDDLSLLPDYSQTLKKVASLISSSLKPGCVPAELPDPDRPDCKVEDITTATDGSITETAIVQCTATMDVLPCWHTLVDPDCAPPASPQSISVRIERPSGYVVPADTSARVECSTKACPASSPDC